MPEARLTLLQPAQLLSVVLRSGITAALTLGPALPASSALLLSLAPVLKGDPGEPGASIASAVAFTPAGNLAATNVQAALQELDGEKLNLTGGTLSGALLIQSLQHLKGTGATTGKIAFADGFGPNTGIQFGAYDSGVGAGGLSKMNFFFSNFTGYTLGLVATASIGFNQDSSGVGYELDTYLKRDAAGILAQRNGLNPQAFRLYNSFTDASNYERGFFRWAANTLEIGAEAGGTGTLRSVAIRNKVRIGSDTDYLYLDPTNRSITGFSGGSYGTTINLIQAGFTIVDTGISGKKVFEATLLGGFLANKISSGSGIGGLTYSPLDIYCNQFPANAVTPAFTVGAYTSSGGAINARIKLFNGDAGKLVLNSNSTGAVEVASGLLFLQPKTVSALPAASSIGAGARAYVTDATGTTFLSIVAGGGANKVPVVSDGTNWLIG